MKKKALKKDFYVEIKKSINRFLSIFFIVVLGVAFLTGIQASAPDMRATGDYYFDLTSLMDLRVISTLGLTEEDLEAVGEIDGIEQVSGCYMEDIYCGDGDAQVVLHMESIPRQMNELIPETGELPQEPGECFLDAVFARKRGYQVGDQLQITVSSEENTSLKRRSFTISGIGNSSTYIALGRGSTTLGTGSVAGYVYVLPEEFDSEVYHVLYAMVEGAGEATAFTPEYDDLVETVRQRLEEIQDERCEIRYAEVKTEAESELEKARQEVEDGEKELEEAQSELEEKEEEAQSELEKSKEELEDGERQLEEGRQELDDAIQKVSDGQSELDQGESELEKNAAELDDGKAQLEEARKKLEEGQKAYEEGMQQYNSQAPEARKKLEDAQKEIDQGEKKLQDGWKEYNSSLKEIEEGEKKLAAAEVELKKQQQEYDKAVVELDNGWKQYNDGKKQLDAGLKEYENGAGKLEEGRKQYKDGLDQLEKGQLQYDQAIAAAQKDLDQAVQKAAEADNRISDNRTRYQEKAGLLQTALGLAEQLKGQLDGANASKKEAGEILAAKEQALQEAKDARDQLISSGAKEEDIAAAEARILAAREERDAAKEAAEAAQREVSRLEGDLSVQKQLAETLQGEVNALEEEYQQTLIPAKTQAETAKGTAQAVLDGTKAQLAPVKEQLDQQRQKLEAARKELEQNEARMKAVKEELDRNSAKLAETKKQLDQNQKKLDDAGKKLSEGWEQIDQTRAQLADGRSGLVSAKYELESSEKELEDAKKKVEDGYRELNSNKQKLDDSKAQLTDGWSELKKSSEKIQDGQKKLDEGRKELQDAKEELEEARQQIRDGKIELAENAQKIEDGWIAYADGEKEASEKLEEGRQKIEDARKDLEDAREKIADAQEEIDSLKYPKWYIGDRDDLPDYTGFGENADRMSNLARVIPVLFFLVAALISLTTMTRMVEEERTQIGTLKALGYSKKDIAGKYLKYAFFATMGGSMCGALFGEKVFPIVIIQAYGILYTYLPKLVVPYHWSYVLIAAGAALFCTIGAALSACYRELQAVPAELMRPPAPKQGKRIWLERIPFLWNHLNFTWKSTARNLIRYKKRFFMTIMGIGGCMGLLLIGYGLQDSIMDVAVLQFEELHKYDAMTILDTDSSEEDQREVRELLESEAGVDASKSFYMQQQDVDTEGITSKNWSVFVCVPENLENLEQFFVFRDRTTGEIYELTEEGAIITEKVANELGLKAGDTVVLKPEGDENVEVPIAAVCENYLSHYLYMTPALYEKVYGEAPEYNSIFWTTDEDQDFIEAVGSRLLDLDGVLNITYTGTMADQLNSMLSAMDVVMVVLIVSAGMLAFVVLYNLNNININERRRELATLKVLGFYNGEVAAYVYRENILLTVIGAALGVVLGKLLHSFVITTVEVDDCMFGRNINLDSFVYGILFTIGFSVLVNLFMYFKLKRIDMVESLKSIE